MANIVTEYSKRPLGPNKVLHSSPKRLRMESNILEARTCNQSKERSQAASDCISSSPATSSKHLRASNNDHACPTQLRPNPSELLPDSTSTCASESEVEENEPSSESDSEESSNVNHEDIPTIRQGSKPCIRPVKGSDLQRRILNFLPVLKAANEDLEKSMASGDLSKLELNEDDEKVQGQYIEMSLGLGVLEERQHSENGDDETTESSSETESENSTVSHQLTYNPKVQQSKQDTNYMNRLLKTKNKPEKPTIEEVNL
ncbi:hypothetical protein FQN57_003958 [Myotisia sp. PD_48]|nr:hypothetical protein FQN57_003958 [Myotisia sp. PD_48]